MYFLTVVCFTVIAFYYQLIFKFKSWAKTRELIRQTTRLVIEFSLKIIPFFIFIYIYNSLSDITYLINGREIDRLLIKFDQLFLFGHDAALLTEKIIHPTLTAWLSIAYVSYFIFYLINPIVYFFLPEKKIFNFVLAAVIITNFLGLIGYILFPCTGPVLAQKNLFTKELIMPSGELYQDSGDLAATYVFNRGAFHCFPSLHFGVTFVWLYFAWKYLRKHKYLNYFYYLHWPLILSLWLATLYLRWHYLTDWLGGLAVALLGIWLAKKIIKPADKITIK